MQDHAKSVENGLVEYANEAAIEKQCKTCHNEESPTYKEFNFKESVCIGIILASFLITE